MCWPAAELGPRHSWHQLLLTPFCAMHPCRHCQRSRTAFGAWEAFWKHSEVSTLVAAPIRLSALWGSAFHLQLHPPDLTECVLLNAALGQPRHPLLPQSLAVQQQGLEHPCLGLWG